MADLKKYDRDPADEARKVRAMGYITQHIQEESTRKTFLSLCERNRDRILIVYATDEENPDSTITIEGYTPNGHFIRSFGITMDDALSMWYGWQQGVDLLYGNKYNTTEDKGNA